jgi:hypothetical protein
VYVKVKVPAPVVRGLKDPPETPVPLYAPPAGLPPVKVTLAAFAHIGDKAPKVTVGKGFTVILVDALDVQPLPLV